MISWGSGADESRLLSWWGSELPQDEARGLGRDTRYGVAAQRKTPNSPVVTWRVMIHRTRNPCLTAAGEWLCPAGNKKYGGPWKGFPQNISKKKNKKQISTF